MAALRGLFRAKSIASTTADKANKTPERMDGVWLDWTGRHRYVNSATVIEEVEYFHRSTSISRVAHTQVARAVYLMTTLCRLRKLIKSIEQDLAITRETFRTAGLLFDPDMPTALLQFLRDDGTIKAYKDHASPIWTEDDVWSAAEGVVGMLAIG